MKLLDTVLNLGVQFGLVQRTDRPQRLQQRYYTPRDPNRPTAKMPLAANPLAYPFSQHAWVHACIDAIAGRCGSVPYRLIVGDDTEVQSGPVYESFSRPNPEFSPSQMWYLTTCHLMLGGNAFWVLERSSERKAPDRAWVFGKDRFKPVWADGERTIIGWEFRNITYRETTEVSEMIPLKPFQVVWFSIPSPHSDFWGVAPLEAARGSAEQDWLANIFNRNFFENAATPGGVLKIRRPLTDKQREQYRLQFDARYQGAERAFRTVLVEGDADYMPFGYTHTDMKFCEQKRMSREEICAVFKCPPSIVGIFDAVHKATAKEVDRQFWEGTVKPLLNLFEDVMRSQFWLPYDKERTWGRFDLSNVEALKDDRDVKLARAEKLFGMGVPFNQINAVEGLGYEDIEGGDVGYLPSGLQPVTDEGMTVEVLPLCNPKPPPLALPEPSAPEPKPQPEPKPAITEEGAPEGLQRAFLAPDESPARAADEQPEATPEPLAATPDAQPTAPAQEPAEKAPETPQPAAAYKVAIIKYGSPEHEAFMKAAIGRTSRQDSGYKQKVRAWFTRVAAYYAAKLADAAERYQLITNLPTDVLALPASLRTTFPPSRKPTTRRLPRP